MLLATDKGNLTMVLLNPIETMFERSSPLRRQQTF